MAYGPSNRTSSTRLMITLVGSAGVGREALFDCYFSDLKRESSRKNYPQLKFTDSGEYKKFRIFAHEDKIESVVVTDATLPGVDCTVHGKVFMQEHDKQRTGPPNDFWQDVNCVLVVFSLTDRQSFEDLPKWFAEIERYAKEGTRVIVVGNDSEAVDQRKISAEEAKAFCDEREVSYVECSAMNNTNVEEAFALVVLQWWKQEFTKEDD